jgi:hypothetical protein
MAKEKENASAATQAPAPALAPQEQPAPPPPPAAEIPGSLQSAFMREYHKDPIKMAESIANSAFVPDSFRDRNSGKAKPVDVMLALMFTESLKLNPLMGLQSMAIIKGRPTLYGDAKMAVARQSRDWDESGYKVWHQVREIPSSNGKPPKRDLFCTVQVKRKGSAHIFTGQFAWSDAERITTGYNKAKGEWEYLSDKDSYRNHPHRMLFRRALGNALTFAGFGELAGVLDSEEAAEMEPAIGSLPAPEPKQEAERPASPPPAWMAAPDREPQSPQPPAPPSEPVDQRADQRADQAAATEGSTQQVEDGDAAEAETTPSPQAKASALVVRFDPPDIPEAAKAAQMPVWDGLPKKGKMADIIKKARDLQDELGANLAIAFARAGYGDPKDAAGVEVFVRAIFERTKAVSLDELAGASPQWDKYLRDLERQLRAEGEALQEAAKNRMAAAKQP